MVPTLKTLNKYMPRVVGCDRLKPLPDRFSAWPNNNGLCITPIEPLLSDGRPTAVDLFAGCGGFSLGFVLAGFRIIASVEWDYWAHVTYAYNIPKAQGAPVHMYNLDIHNLTGREILFNAHIKDLSVVIGGPPCPSFSNIGQRKVGDERDLLLWEYGRLVKELQPKTFIMENVPGLRTKKFPDGRKVLDVFLEFMDAKDVNYLRGILTKSLMEVQL
jgi:site-specific DNA-cytosine methylase